MAKKKEKRVNVSRKPKHSLDVNRNNDSKKEKRSATTVRRLKMYNTRPSRNRKGKVLSNEFQSKNLPSTRIPPDRSWLLNTRVVSQKEPEVFREEMQKCSAATVHRLKRYNSRPNRNRRGKVLSNEFQSKNLPSTRFPPDRSWLLNTRIVSHKELEVFREEMQNRRSSNYDVILNEKKLPLLPLKRLQH